MNFSLGLTLDAGRSRIFAPVGSTVPDAFSDTDWNVVDAGTGATVSVDVTSLPWDGGSAIVAVEYRIDSGPWLASGLAGTGVFQVSGLTDGQAVAIALRAVNSLGAGSASLDKIVVPTDGVAPTVAASTINTATEEIDISGVSESGTYFGLINYSGAVLAGADIEAQVVAGTADATVSFAVVSGSNTGLMDKSGVAAGPAWLHGTIKDASGNYSIDMPLEFTQPSPVSPILSNPLDAANGATASTASVSVDQKDGTLYVVVTTLANAPSAAQIIAGQDAQGAPAAWAGSQVVTASGVQTVTPAPSGLSPSTSHVTHFLFEDIAGLQSAVVSAAGFTTSASGGGGQPSAGAASTAVQANAPTIALANPTNLAGDEIFYFVAGAATHPVLTPQGLTLVATLPPNGSSDTAVQVFRKTSDGNEPASVSFDADTTNSNGWADRVAHAIAVSGAGAPAVGVIGAVNTGYSNAPVALSLSATAGSLIFEVFGAEADITLNGAVASAAQGSCACAVAVTEAVAGGATSDRNASLGASNHWTALQLEVLG